MAGTVAISWNEAPETANLTMLCPQNGESRRALPTVVDPNDCDSHQFSLLNQAGKGTVTLNETGFLYHNTDDQPGEDWFGFRITDAGGLEVDVTATVLVMSPAFFEAIAAWPETSMLSLIEAINQPAISQHTDYLRQQQEPQ